MIEAETGLKIEGARYSLIEDGAFIETGEPFRYALAFESIQTGRLYIKLPDDIVECVDKDMEWPWAFVVSAIARAIKEQENNAPAA